MRIVNLVHWLACRNRKRPLTTIVLHATAGGSASGAIATLKARGLSYHAIVEDGREQDGEVNKCVPDNKVAYHAGKSIGPDGPNVNDYSLGASFVNLNDGKDPYSKAQVDAMLERCATWLKTYPSIKYLTTHYWVSPGRKSDPRNAPGFDIEDFHARLKEMAGPVILWKGK